MRRRMSFESTNLIGSPQDDGNGNGNGKRLTSEEVSYRQPNARDGILMIKRPAAECRMRNGSHDVLA
jgi:hypothetical protein